MARNWFYVARAEFQVQTTSIRNNRVKVTLGLLLVGIIWALLISPVVMNLVITEILGVPTQLIVILMPGLMRALMIFIWFLLFVFPLSNALKEVKIGQWEILLSNNVTSRDIFTGSFLGKLPINGLLVLYLAPLIVSPFALALNISLLGQALIYGCLAITAISTIWLADFVTTAIQSKLGESSRGKDIANALAMLFSLVAIIPFVGLQVFGGQMVEVLGWDIFLLLPFTWSADIITRIAFLFNGIELSASSLASVEAALGLNLVLNTLFLAGFTLVIVGLALVTTERLFTANLESRTERVTTTRGEKLIYRVLRLVIPGNFGVVVITALKDFVRKAQNLSRVGMMLGMAIVLPLLVSSMTTRNGGSVEMISILVIMALAFALLSSQAFGGSGFLESKNQLWIIQGVPKGTRVFVMARLVQAMLFIVPAALFCSGILTFIVDLTLIEFGLLSIVGLTAGIGAAMIGIGVTASNPTYEDSSDSTLKANIGRSIGITIVSFMAYTIIDMVLGIVFGLNDAVDAIFQNQYLYILAQVGPLAIIGTIVLLWGMRKLSKLE
ncbi:MAG: hypothetical protein P1Q69_16675 [Candidatus Thorarchaeota archaeon]|nr:hypothetical protein [Candidatus Thorarchaeota archaeon]